MKRLVLVALALILVAPGAAAGEAPVSVAVERATEPLFAAGGSALTNGFFFPGTAIYNDNDGSWIGVPYEITRGSDIEFTTTDGELTLGNGHKIMSFKRRKKSGRPLFQSKMLYGPGSTIMITSHLKPGKGDGPEGSYLYTCTVHTGMFGMLKVVPD